MAHESSSIPSPLLSLDHRSSSERNQNPDDLILGTLVSSNPPPFPTPSRTRKSPNPKRLVLGSEGTSSQNPSHERDESVVLVNLNEIPDSTAQDKDGWSSPIVMEQLKQWQTIWFRRWCLRRLRFLQRKGLGYQGQWEWGKDSTSRKKVSDILGGKDLTVHESGEKYPQEEPPITNPLEWDGTPLRLLPAIVASLTHEDDEVPLNLVFRKKAIIASQQSPKVKKGTKRGPIT
ncbi:hypothetical protein HAX54_020053 [Datura stramonium]|uniref:Uncharacterized protein n=1 Tax=Datura stramonium TaxID=4076 RepID=A0ABS8USB2_DATST|nr:hypothetical protein [Datura stramonium]